MASRFCICNSCHKCSRLAMIRGLHAAQLIEPSLYDRIIDGQLSFLRTLEGGRGHCLQFCEDLLDYLVFAEQYTLAQHTVRKFVLPRELMNSSIVWLTYKVFRADPGTPEPARLPLPLDIGYALSDLGVHLGDIIELWEIPGWTAQFDWVVLAQNQRAQLSRMLQHAPRRLPAHFWEVIKATWMLQDAGAELALHALCIYASDGYCFAQNATASGLAWAATRNFEDLDDIYDPESSDNLTSFYAVSVPKTGDPAYPACSFVGAGGR